MLYYQCKQVVFSYESPILLASTALSLKDFFQGSIYFKKIELLPNEILKNDFLTQEKKFLFSTKTKMYL